MYVKIAWLIFDHLWMNAPVINGDRRAIFLFTNNLGDVHEDMNNSDDRRLLPCLFRPVVEEDIIPAKATDYPQFYVVSCITISHDNHLYVKSNFSSCDDLISEIPNVVPEFTKLEKSIKTCGES